jgi:hypothetical protein
VSLSYSLRNKHLPKKRPLKLQREISHKLSLSLGIPPPFMDIRVTPLSPAAQWWHHCSHFCLYLNAPCPHSILLSIITYACDQARTHTHTQACYHYNVLFHNANFYKCTFTTYLSVWWAERQMESKHMFLWIYTPFTWKYHLLHSLQNQLYYIQFKFVRIFLSYTFNHNLALQID